MGTIHHPDQPELPIVQQITCRRCRGAGEVYYARLPADVVGGSASDAPNVVAPESSTLLGNCSGATSYLITRNHAEGGGPDAKVQSHRNPQPSRRNPTGSCQ